MEQRAYRIIMHTAIGDRKGSMDVCVDHEKIWGNMTLLKKKEPFSGHISPGGNFQIIGKVTTLLRSIPYTAFGTISEEAIMLKISDGNHEYQINGTLSESAPANR